MDEQLDDQPRLHPAHVALILVCVAHALSPLILRGLHAGYGWDETVYISQIDPHVPAGIFTAPRARGLTLLTAPASYLSGSIAVMRVWLAILSGVGMYLAFFPWLRLRRNATVPVAAALFSGLWVGIFYSYAAMPNQYVAYGALAATGWLLLALRDSRRRRDVGYLAVAIAFTALMRPTDTLFLLAPIILVALVTRTIRLRRRFVLIGVALAGYAAGLAEWVAEAYVRFGGPVQRFLDASKENTGGVHWSLGAQFRVLGGPTLCRAGCVPTTSPSEQLWWYALVPLVGLGLVAAWRTGTLRLHLLVVLAAAVLATQYLVAISYAAPRFLEPSYALLALPVAEGVVWLCTRASPVIRPAVIAAAVAVAVVAEAPQLHALHTVSRADQAEWDQDAAVGEYLHAHGVTGPQCWIGGHEEGEISFVTACRDIAGRGRDAAKVIAHTTGPVALISARAPDADATYPTTTPGSTTTPRVVEGPLDVDGFGVWIVLTRSHPRLRSTGRVV